MANQQMLSTGEVKWALGSITMNKASGGDGIPVVLFQILKMMLWKCCTQYASKFGKHSSGHRTGKGQFSFQSRRKAMPKNAQTTAQLHSSHTLVKWCSKFSKPGFSNTWTVNFQMFKLVLEKAEEPEIKLPTSTGSLKKQESSRRTSISALVTMPNPLCGSQQTVENTERDGNTRPPDLPLEKFVCRSGSNSSNWTWNNRLVPSRNKRTSRLYIVTLRI